MLLNRHKDKRKNKTTQEDVTPKAVTKKPKIKAKPAPKKDGE